MNHLAETIATDLLKINAVSLRPNHPFTWASGLKSPIYCDNRLTIGYPAIRQLIAKSLADIIQKDYPEVEVIAGTATAGIPHAAWVADLLALPLIYIRSKPKDHGQGRQIEGPFKSGQKIIIIDDLISTGGSVLQAATAAKNEGAKVLAVLGIFSYGLSAGSANFEQAGIPLTTLSNLTALINVAQQQGQLTTVESQSLAIWRQDPKKWSARH